MSRVSRLDDSDDWTFGKGKADYVRRSEAIRQSVVTRLRSFTNDWFLDVNHGLPWLEMLGERNTERRILREIEKSILGTDGVRAIDKLELVEVDPNRAAEIAVTVVDIYDERYDETVSIDL